MVAEIPFRQGERYRQILHGLIQEKGLAPSSYALFFCSGEGNFLPISTDEDEVEETSGYVLDKGGHVHSFWFGWDIEKRKPTLTEWHSVKADPEWLTSAEFRQARASLGLTG